MVRPAHTSGGIGMTAYRLRGPAKTTVCATCGGKNRTHKGTCSYCQRDAEIAARPIRTCAFCLGEISHNRTRLSPYCSCTCAMAVSAIAQKAGAAVNYEIHHGRIQKLAGDVPCVDCGKPACQYDHRDYTKPLEVVPVCRSCNYKRGPADVIRHHFEEIAA